MRRMIAMAALVALVTIGCTTTRQETRTLPDGSITNVTVKVPDVAKTEQVKAVAEAVVTIAMRRAMEEFPQEADNVAFYARAVGGVFCDMQARKQFDPEALEAGIAALVLPHIEDPKARLYIKDARDILILNYRVFWSNRFKAELKPDEWPLAVSEIFCDAIDQGLRDAGRPGVK